MSVDHHERIKGVVKDALKSIALGEPFGFALSSPAFWPFLDQQGNVVGQGVAWFVVVSIRATGLGEPDIHNGFPVPGMLPPDEDFRIVARKMFEACIAQREAQDKAVLEAVPAGPAMSLKDRPA